MHDIDGHVDFRLPVPAYHVVVLAKNPRWLLGRLPLGEAAAVGGRFLLAALDRRLEFRRPLLPYLLALDGYLAVGTLDLR